MPKVDNLHNANNSNEAKVAHYHEMRQRNMRFLGKVENDLKHISQNLDRFGVELKEIEEARRQILLAGIELKIVKPRCLY